MTEDNIYEGACIWKGHAEEALDNCGKKRLKEIVETFNKTIRPQLEIKNEEKGNVLIQYFSKLEQKYL